MTIIALFVVLMVITIGLCCGIYTVMVVVGLSGSTVEVTEVVDVTVVVPPFTDSKPDAPLREFGTPRARTGDQDCRDFRTWREAQDFYVENGGPHRDPHNLDADRDGIACEALR